MLVTMIQSAVTHERAEVGERDVERDAGCERDPAEHAQGAGARDEAARRAEHHHAETGVEGDPDVRVQRVERLQRTVRDNLLTADVRQRQVEERGEHEGPGGQQVAAGQHDVPERSPIPIGRPHGLQQADPEEDEQRRCSREHERHCDLVRRVRVVERPDLRRGRPAPGRVLTEAAEGSDHEDHETDPAERKQPARTRLAGVARDGHRPLLSQMLPRSEEGWQGRYGRDAPGTSGLTRKLVRCWHRLRSAR